MKKILIIEDDLIDQMTFTRMLKKQDFAYTHTMVNSIHAAKKELHEHTFDLVISDHNLPDGTAFDLLSDFKNTPFILITGNEDTLTVKAMAQNKNAVACFSKDINFNYLEALPKVMKTVFAQKNTSVSKNNSITNDQENTILQQENIIIDFSNAYKIFDGKKQEVKEAIELFIQYKPEEMNALYQHINHNDCDKVIDISHRMKSGFKLFGMTPQVALAEFIEKNAKNLKDKCQCVMINDTFKQLSSDTKIAIEILKKELPLF